MSDLTVNKQTIQRLFDDKKADFLIPDYQRPYAWGEEECQTLWDDLFSFAFPENDRTKFKDNDSYFLGPIVSFRNEHEKIEIIDGQQRLTTLMLLLRAFYAKMEMGKVKDQNYSNTRQNIEKCLWKTDEFGNPDKNALKIDSKVITDNNKEEFLTILKTGEIPKNSKSNYAQNYSFFQKKIQEFNDTFPGYFPYLPNRILNNCILLPIEAYSQDMALQIFSTLNDRGKPLADADIFKAELYKYYSSKSQKDTFITRWKDLEEQTDSIFKGSDYSMDELFIQYMYYERAKQPSNATKTTTEAVRKFYEKNEYALLKKDESLNNLEKLTEFWGDVSRQNQDRFDENTLKKLYVLNYAPNRMWTYLVSVYFTQNQNNWDKEHFLNFLNKIIGFIFAYTLAHPTVSALRTPVYPEMANIVTGQDVTFQKFKFNKKDLKNIYDTYNFSNNRSITRSLLTWWMFEKCPNQKLPPLKTEFQIEHIFAKKRQEIDGTLSDGKLLESLGNKVLLERRINISASNYRFQDKKKYYLGEIKKKDPTIVQELINFKEKEDFTEQDIKERNEEIINSFINYLDRLNLLDK